MEIWCILCIMCIITEWYWEPVCAEECSRIDWNAINKKIGVAINIWKSVCGNLYVAINKLTLIQPPACSKDMSTYGAAISVWQPEWGNQCAEILVQPSVCGPQMQQAWYGIVWQYWCTNVSVAINACQSDVWTVWTSQSVVQTMRTMCTSSQSHGQASQLCEQGRQTSQLCGWCRQAS